LRKITKESVMKIIKTMIVLALTLLPPGVVSAQLLDKKVLTLEAAMRSPASPVTHLPAKQVNEAFVKGMPLIRGMNYKIDASHRDEPGAVEIHTRDTDLIYMLEGSATLVTGGTVIDSKTIEPEEIRGRESKGGESRTITKGDVVVIPAGTPHWFKEVNGPINYYVVKVRSAN
jgi:glc operon protein GlcG